MSSLGPIPIDPKAADEQLVTRLGIRLITCRPDLVVATMPVEGNRQPYGILHGGANAVLAETVGSIAAFTRAGPGGNAVGLELSCTHHRWVANGLVTATCRPLAEKATLATYDIAITDAAQRRTSTARLTCAISPGRRR